MNRYFPRTRIGWLAFIAAGLLFLGLLGGLTYQTAFTSTVRPSMAEYNALPFKPTLDPALQETPIGAARLRVGTIVLTRVFQKGKEYRGLHWYSQDTLESRGSGYIPLDKINQGGDMNGGDSSDHDIGVAMDYEILAGDRVKVTILPLKVASTVRNAWYYIGMLLTELGFF